MNEVIDEKVIEACEIAGACNEGLNWLRAQPRTFSDMRTYRPEWLRWMAGNIGDVEVLTKLAEDTISDVRCNAKKTLQGLLVAAK